MKRSLLATGLLAIAVFSMVGCGKKADTNKPIEEVRAEAEKMTVGDLESTAKSYAKEIEGKKSEVEKIKTQLSTLSPQELFGEKAKNIKDEAAKLGSQLSALSERYQIYAEKYQALGGDLSKIKVE